MPTSQELKAHGHEFHLIYLWLPQAELAVQRVAERVRLGGHIVAERIIRRRYDKSLSNFFSLYLPFADSWLMVDNSTPAAPRHIAWRNVGGPVQIVRTGPFLALRKQYEQDILHDL